jgi:hypothetical protein
MITNRTYGMDADVIAYNARIVAGGNQSLSMQSLRQLNQFVISIKKIGLWYNMICWPLKANQNAGSGIIAYSLGGFGILNGTLISNPTWGPTGIILNDPNQYISLSGASINAGNFTSLSVLSTIASNNSTNLFGLFQYLPINPTRGPFYTIYGPTGNGVMRIGSLTGGSGSRDKGNQNVTNVGIGFYYASAGVSDLSDPVNSTGFVQLNSTRNTTSSGSGTLPYTFNSNLYWLFGFQGSIRNEIASFQAWFSGIPLTQSQLLQIQNIYKSTLGEGLALP